MSSGISTNELRLKADPQSDHRSVRLQPDQTTAGLQAWMFFVLAGLGCATAVSILLRGQGPAAVILGTLLIGGATLIGMAALRALRPLVSPEDDRAAAVGERARAALEREKILTLRTIKELEFDRAMGKLSDGDFHEMSGRLRARAARLMRQLDAGAGYRAQIERELAKRIGESADRLKPRAPSDVERACASCATVNDLDARFCKSCGAKL